MTSVTLPAASPAATPARQMSVSIVGLGKLGSPIAAATASKGIRVVGMDADPVKVQAISGGRAPVYEPGLDRLLEAGAPHISATSDLHEAVLATDATFLIVPTPSDERGEFSPKFVLDACTAIGAALRHKAAFHIVVVTSTLMPGTTEREVLPLLEAQSGMRCGVDFGLCYSPEFVALGTVIRDFLTPDFVLIGESDTASGDWLETFYAHVCDNNPQVARMSMTNAELTKIAVNTYVTTKITFANMLARMCERLPGGDVDAVTAALGMDSRIGPKYLKGAIGYGGPCFPRDNVAFAAAARALGVSAQLAETTHRMNQAAVGTLADRVVAELPAGGAVGILGLSYKPETDVVEEAQGLLLAKALVERRVRVFAYDPIATAAAMSRLREGVTFAAGARECIAAADVVVVTTPWTEFRSLTEADFARQGRPRVLLDCWRTFSGQQFTAAVRYLPMGRSTNDPLDLTS